MIAIIITRHENGWLYATAPKGTSPSEFSEAVQARFGVVIPNDAIEITNEEEGCTFSYPLDPTAV